METEEVPRSMPEALFERAARSPSSVALRRKRFGIWEELTWSAYAEAARRVAAALAGLGVQPGEQVGILSENRPEWLFSDLGILAAGAVSTALHAGSAIEDIVHSVRRGGVRVVFVDGVELPKALALSAQVELRRIVLLDEKSRASGEPLVVSMEDFLAEGARVIEAEPGAAARYRGRGPDDPAIVVHTAGTTGEPKGVKLSHRSLGWACSVLRRVAGAGPADEYLSFLPLSHVTERVVSVFNPVANGGVVNFAESLEAVHENLTEVRPHVVFAVPRIWEKLFNQVDIRMRSVPFAKREAYAWALEVGRAYLEARSRAAGPPVHRARVTRGLRLQHRLSDAVVLSPLRARLGLDRVRLAVSGAGPISPVVLQYFQSVGVPLVEAYGMTEATALVALGETGILPPGTIGRPLPDVEIRIAEDGEVLVRSPGVMLGYDGDDRSTASSLDGGWLRTGDAGFLDRDGRLCIADRKKDLIVIEGGERVAPQELESKLRRSPYIRDAVVLGGGRGFVTALIVPDEDTCVEWAIRSGRTPSSFEEIGASPELQRLIAAEIDGVNATMPGRCKIERFRVVPGAAGEELDVTPTLKVRRSAIARKYAHLVEAMRAENGEPV